MLGKRSDIWYQTIAGVALLLAGLVAFMGIITAEALYPADYTTHDNEISDLGATRPPDSIIEQPSSSVFSGAMIVTGLLVLLATYCIHNIHRLFLLTIPIGLLGIGVLGVGVFNGSWGGIHATFALLTFSAGGVSAILFYKAESVPYRYVSILLGAVALGTLVVYIFSGEEGPLSALGIGGIERWVAYPILLWILSYGAYLMGGVTQSTAASNEKLESGDAEG